MKKLILFLLVVFCFLVSKAQAVDGAVNGLIDAKIKSYNATLDSVLGKSISSSTATTIVDTLLVDPGFVCTFFINLSVENITSKDIGGGTKIVTIKNVGGVYTVVINTDISKYSGQNTLSTFAWTIPIKNNIPVIQVAGKALPLKFTIFRIQNKVTL